MGRGIASLPPQDLNEVFDEQGETEAVCRFCGKRYRFTRDEIAAIAEKMKK